MKNNLLLLFLMIIIVSLTSTGCKNSPNEISIVGELNDFDFSTIKKGSYDEYEVKSVEINQSQIREYDADFWCTVSFENETYRKMVDMEISFDYFDQGGWKINTISDFDYKYLEIIGGYSESQAIETFCKGIEPDSENSQCDDSDYEKYSYDSVQVIEHITDLNRGMDKFVFEVDEEGIMLSKKGTATMIYCADSDDGWVYKNISEHVSVTDVHPTGAWEHGGYIHSFESYDDKYINVAYYNCFHSETKGLYYTVEYKTYEYDLNNIENGEFYMVDINNKYKEFIYLNDISKYTSYSYSPTLNLGNYELSYGKYEKNYKGDKSNLVKLPDVIGMTAKKAKETLKEAGFVIEKHWSEDEDYEILNDIVSEVSCGGDKIEAGSEFVKNTKVHLSYGGFLDNME